MDARDRAGGADRAAHYRIWENVDQVVIIGRLGHAVRMVAELIEPSNDLTLPWPVMISCLENWFTNYRLLIEFLMMPKRNRASAQDFAVGWSPDSSQKESLGRDYGWASKNVSHIGLSPALDEPLQEVTPNVLRDKARHLFTVIESFADGLPKRSEWEYSIRMALEEGRVRVDLPAPP